MTCNKRHDLIYCKHVQWITCNRATRCNYLHTYKVHLMQQKRHHAITYKTTKCISCNRKGIMQLPTKLQSVSHATEKTRRVHLQSYTVSRVNKTNRCTEFQFYWYYDSTSFGQPFCPSSGVLSRTSALYILCSCDDCLLPEVGWNCVPSYSW